MKRLFLLTALLLGCPQGIPEPTAAPCPEVPPSERCESVRKSGPYTPLAPPSVEVTLPDVPPPSLVPERRGEEYSVRGIKRLLRDPEEGPRLADQPVVVVGYVVATNFAEAPGCALHPAGRADPPGCVSPLPELELADEPSGTQHRLRVMGFAANFPQMISAQKHEKKKGTEPYLDEFWAVPVPSPLPAPGAKVRVVGTVSQRFTRSAGGLVVDPRGILTYSRLTYLEPPPTPAVLGAGRRPR